MKRTTIKSLQRDAERENKENGCESYDWCDILIYRVYIGNLGEVRKEIESMSKKDMLEVITTCVDKVECSQWENSDIMRVYNYAVNALKSKL